MVKQSFGDRVFGIAVHACLVLVLLLILYPLLFVVSASVSNPALVVQGKIWLLPSELTFVGYQKVFHNHEILSGYMNTILYTVLGTAINLVMTVMAAYPLSLKDFAGRHIITAFITFTMFFGGGLIPTYLLIKDLHMINTVWAMVIPGAVSVWNIIIMRTFFQNGIPSELHESASIDGCGNLLTLWKIILPLSMPIIAVMILFYSVGHWNSYFNALIYLSDRDKYPLQLLLREILIKGEMDGMLQAGGGLMTENADQMLESESIKYAIVIVANLPILMLYPFLQKFFVKGVMIGAIKG